MLFCKCALNLSIYLLRLFSLYPNEFQKTRTSVSASSFCSFRLFLVGFSFVLLSFTLVFTVAFTFFFSLSTHTHKKKPKCTLEWCVSNTRRHYLLTTSPLRRCGHHITAIFIFPVLHFPRYRPPLLRCEGEYAQPTSTAKLFVMRLRPVAVWGQLCVFDWCAK